MAIVGMGAVFGSVKSLEAFKETIFNGRSILAKPPAHRWNGSDSVLERLLGGKIPEGGYLDHLIVELGEFHTPPNEMPDILIQQMLMLKVAAQAMADAGLSRQTRSTMGTVIGIDFDFETTDFHLRWNLSNKIGQWRDRLDRTAKDRHAVFFHKR